METAAIIIVIILICFLVIPTSIAMLHDRKKEKKEQEKEEEKKKTKCVICNECSMGKTICDSCFNKSILIQRELPLTETSLHNDIITYKHKLMLESIRAKTSWEREIINIKLLSITTLYLEKYSDKNATKRIIRFFKDEIEAENSEELIEKWELYENHDLERNNSEEEIDYRQAHKRPFRCNDGDYVRSKTEREIDNFFFERRIWHIYEKEYTAFSGKKYYPDFYLPDYNLYLEYFGLSTKEYLSKMQTKINMYRIDPNIKFEYLTGEDDANIVEKLIDICAKHNIK